MHSALYLPKPSAQLLPPYLNPDVWIVYCIHTTYPPERSYRKSPCWIGKSWWTMFHSYVKKQDGMYSNYQLLQLCFFPPHLRMGSFCCKKCHMHFRNSAALGGFFNLNKWPGIVDFPSKGSKFNCWMGQSWPMPWKYFEDFEVQRERYIRMLVADGQGPSISYRKGPMYVSIYLQLFGRGSLSNFLMKM